MRYFTHFFILGSESAVDFTLIAISVHMRLVATIMAFSAFSLSTL